MQRHREREQLHGTFTGVKHIIYTLDNPDGTSPPMYHDSGTYCYKTDLNGHLIEIFF